MQHRVPWTWLALGSVFVAGWLGWLFFWSYCWHWLGANPPLWQYTFACACPPESEEARYPPNVDVFVPACLDPTPALVSPSGRFLLLFHRHSDPHRRYLHDLQTGQVHPLDFIAEGRGLDFITDEWLLEIDRNHSTVDEDIQYAMVNIWDQRRLPLRRIHVPPDHRLEPDALAPFRNAEQVYVLFRLAVAITPDFPNQPNQSFVVGRLSSNPTATEEIIALLQANRIPYEEQTTNRVSHDGRFSHDGTRVYLRSSQELLTEISWPQWAIFFVGQGWDYANRGMIAHPQEYSVIGGPPGIVLFPRFLHLPLPILLWKVPPDYMSPEAQQLEAAQQAREAAALADASRVFWVVFGGGLALLVGAGVVGWRRGRSLAGEVKPPGTLEGQG